MLDLIKGIYSVFLRIAVIVSSFIFVFLFLFSLLAFITLSGNLMTFFLVISSFCLILLLFPPLKKFKNIRIDLVRITTIFGSILVIILFLNSYLSISNPLKELFLDMWEPLEEFLQKGVISMVVSIVTPVILVMIPFAIISFVLKILERFLKGKDKILGYIGLLLLLFSFIPLLVFSYNFKEWSREIFNYSLELSNLFGFSLVILHSNYLIKELRDFLKKSSLNRF